MNLPKFIKVHESIYQDDQNLILLNKKKSLETVWLWPCNFALASQMLANVAE